MVLGFRFNLEEIQKTSSIAEISILKIKTTALTKTEKQTSEIEDQILGSKLRHTQS